MHLTPYRSILLLFWERMYLTPFLSPFYLIAGNTTPLARMTPSRTMS